MMAPSDAWKTIRASVDLTPEEIVECAKVLDEEFGERTSEDTIEYASVRLSIDKTGKISFRYRKDKRVTDKNLALSLLQTAAMLLSKEEGDVVA